MRHVIGFLSSFLSLLYHAGVLLYSEYGDAHVGSINQVGLSQECLLFREDLVAFNRVLWRFAREKPGVFLFYTDGCLTLFI